MGPIAKPENEREEETQKKPSSVTPPRVEVLLQKLIFPQLVKKFPEFYATRTFSIVSKTARYLSQLNQVHGAPNYIP
jgi:hypothetical protein